MFAKYAHYYDLFNRDKPYKDEIEFVYQWADKPKSIFDIGAGTGNYWRHYPKGTDIFGIDKSRDMAHQNKNIVCGDITHYKHSKERFDCATALFDVLNYIQKHDWWKNIPVSPGGFFIFDVWSKEKVDKEGFKETWKEVQGIGRNISLIKYDGQTVDLKIELFSEVGKFSEEHHRMYLYSRSAIERFCGDEFEIVDVKPTKRWQTWYKCKRK